MSLAFSRVISFSCTHVGQFIAPKICLVAFDSRFNVLATLSAVLLTKASASCIVRISLALNLLTIIQHGGRSVKTVRSPHFHRPTNMLELHAERVKCEN